MKAKDVRKRVRHLRAKAKESRDYEALHGDEDTLHQEVLAAIALEGVGWEGDLAREAVKTLKIKFARHCS